MSEKREPKIVFDIVNSVKGGSGKSTVALQLAAFWASREDTDAYIIDLDLRGTSWKTNCDKYFLPTDSSNKYINSLMYNFGPEDSIFWHLSVVCENTMPQAASPKSVIVHLCIGNPDISGDVDAVKVDLLESAVFEIIKRAFSKSEEKKEVHIIFDMPPSYESHAERVVKHLLMDKESSLFKKYYKGKRGPYYVNLLMIYAITGAHVEQNLVYTKEFFIQTAYSSEISAFIEDETFSLYFLGNDVSDALSAKPDSISNILDKIRGLFQERLASPNVNEKLKNNLMERMQVIGHMSLGLRNLQYFLNTALENAEPRLMPEAASVFKQVFLSENQIHDT